MNNFNVGDLLELGFLFQFECSWFWYFKRKELFMFDGNVCYIFSSDFFHSGLNINFLKQTYGNKKFHSLSFVSAMSPMLFSERTIKFNFEQ